MAPSLLPSHTMKEGGAETLEASNIPPQGHHPNTRNHFMTGFESPVLPTHSSHKRKSGWLLFLISLVLLWATAQYYNPRKNVRGIPSRVFGPDYASRVVEPLSDSKTIGSSGLSRTDQVQFDNYSLILRGQRIFLQYDTFTLSRFFILPPSAPENFTHLGYLFRRSGRTF